MPGRNGLCVLSFGRRVFQTDLAMITCPWHPTSASAGESAAAASAATRALRHHTCDQLAYSCRGSFRGPRSWRQWAPAALELQAWAQRACSMQARSARPRQCHTNRHAQHMRTNPLAQGLAQCARPCAVSTVHTGTLCAAVTRERAYTATGQRQKHPGNQHPPAYTSTANRRGCGGRACP